MSIAKVVEFAEGIAHNLVGSLLHNNACTAVYMLLPVCDKALLKKSTADLYTLW